MAGSNPISLLAARSPAELPAGLTTLTELLRWRVQKTPDWTAYSWWDGDRLASLDWRGVAEQAARYRKALRAEALNSGDRVAICARNNIEWVLFEQAALSLGFVVVPLFYNDRPDSLAWCLEHSGAQIVLIEDPALWDAVAPHAPGIRRAILLGPAAGTRSVPLDRWLPADGEAFDSAERDAGALATIVYTSGTTGRPKGVMLSHGNILDNLRGLFEGLPSLVAQRHRLLSFLPLSHMLERTVGEYVPMAAGWEVIFGHGVQALAEDLKTVQPTLIVSVPRVFERIYQRMDEQMGCSRLRRWLFERAVTGGWHRFRHTATLMDRLLQPLLDAVVGRRLRAVFGGQLKVVFLGGAPMPARLFEIFIGLGLTFIHGYGLTETSPVISCNRVEDNEPLSVGRPVPGVEVRLGDDGEIYTKGPNVMLGYWRDPDATREVVSADGWFRTGDLARIDGGRIYLSGRRKEIIVMSNGEKVSPQDAEQAILADPVFEQVMLVGEGRPGLALVVVTKSSDEAELLDRANRQLHDFPGYVQVQRVLRMADPWTIANGLLTPTLKLKRGEIERRYAVAIDGLYSASGSPRSV